MGRAVRADEHVKLVDERVTVADVDRAFEECGEEREGLPGRVGGHANIEVRSRRRRSGRYSITVHRRVPAPLRPVMVVEYVAPRHGLRCRFRPSALDVAILLPIIIGLLAVTLWVFAVAVFYRPDVAVFGIAFAAFWAVLTGGTLAIFQRRLRADAPHLWAAVDCVVAELSDAQL